MTKGMRIGFVALLVLVVALGAAAVASAQGQRGQGGNAGGNVRRGGGMGMAMGRGGYLTPNKQSKALWDKIGKLQTQMHSATWQLFVLMAKKPRDEKKVKAQQEALRGIMGNMRKVSEQLRPYWHEEPGAGGGGRSGAAPRGGR